MNVKVFDWQGREQDLGYLLSRYGQFPMEEAPVGEGPVYRITTLRERADGPVEWVELSAKGKRGWQPEATASLVVRVVDETGLPIEGVRVAWFWPDAPQDAAGGGWGRCVSGLTGANGDVGFGMGMGAYYQPWAGQVGPHAVWIYGRGINVRCDLIGGLGMLWATNHYHFDVEYTLVIEEAPPPPAPDEMRDLLAGIQAAAVTIGETAEVVEDLAARGLALLG